MTDGPLTGTVGTGWFSYDSDLIMGVGEETIDPTDGLQVSFTIFGQTFTQMDDVGFDDYPLLTFEDGSPTILDFIVSEDGPNVTPINHPWVRGFSMYDLTPLASGGFSVEVSVDYYPIPEPSGAAFGLVAGLGMAGFIGYRRLNRGK